MNQPIRMLDANCNRAAEGIRVLEDIARFLRDDGAAAAQLKALRHTVRKAAPDLQEKKLSARESGRDVGLSVSSKLKVDGKSTVTDLLAANFKRAQEAVRVCEETLFLLQRYEDAKTFEQIRFRLYTLEKELSLPLCRQAKADRIREAGIYCLTAQAYSLGRSNLEVVRRMLDAGVRIIQYREKEMEKLQKYRECMELTRLCHEAGALFLVDDDLDLAVLSDADGVHIGQEDLPIEEARKLLPQDKIIGLSTHSPEQAQDAVKRGADYIGVGPIYKTYTKKNVVDPVGLSYLSYVAQNLEIPYVAIGGIKEHNIQDVVRHGGRCIALVTEIVGAQEIETKIHTLNEKISQTLEEKGQ